MKAKKEIKFVLSEYIQTFKWTPTRWDCLNYLIGYYGSIGAEHIEVITELTRAGKILP